MLNQFHKLIENYNINGIAYSSTLSIVLWKTGLSNSLRSQSSSLSADSSCDKTIESIRFLLHRISESPLSCPIVPKDSVYPRIVWNRIRRKRKQSGEATTSSVVFNQSANTDTHPPSYMLCGRLEMPAHWVSWLRSAGWGKCEFFLLFHLFDFRLVYAKVKEGHKSERASQHPGIPASWHPGIRRKNCRRHTGWYR